MYELCARARFIVEVPKLGERVSVWSHKTGKMKGPANHCRTIVSVRKRSASDGILDDDEDDDTDPDVDNVQRGTLNELAAPLAQQQPACVAMP